MSAVLKNTSKQMQIHELPHDLVCEGEDDGCLCEDVTLKVSVLNPESGDKAWRHVDKTINDSVHIAVGETSRPLPDGALKVPSIAAALKRRELIEVKSAPVPVVAEPSESAHAE